MNWELGFLGIRQNMRIGENDKFDMGWMVYELWNVNWVLKWTYDMRNVKIGQSCKMCLICMNGLNW